MAETRWTKKRSSWTFIFIFREERYCASYFKSFMMSLTLVCLYIIIGLCFLLFVNYKFLKLFIATLNQKFTTDANRNNTKITNKNTSINNNNIDNQYSKCNNNNSNHPNVSQKTSNVWSIPGPLKVPFLGTKWIYLWKYKMSKIHEVYRGKVLLNHSWLTLF